MRKLTVLVILLAALWGGWWFVGSSAELKAVKAGFARAAAEGRTATYTDMSVAGFPNRFDLTVTGLALGDPARGITWKAPFAQLLALSYNPWHFIAALPHEQALDLPGETLNLATTRLEASVAFTPGIAYRLSKAIAVAKAPRLSSSAGWTISADSLDAATRALPGHPATQEIGLRAEKVTPDPALKAAADPEGKLPATVEQAYLDAEATLVAPLDRSALKHPPQLTALDLKDAHLIWGPLHLTAAGRIEVTPEGLPEGRISLTAKPWRDLVPVLVGLGLVKPELRETITNMFEALTKGTADPDQVALPLSFQKGFVSIGPLPLGPAPRLR